MCVVCSVYVSRGRPPCQLWLAPPSPPPRHITYLAGDADTQPQWAATVSGEDRDDVAPRTAAAARSSAAPHRRSPAHTGRCPPVDALWLMPCGLCPVVYALWFMLYVWCPTFDAIWLMPYVWRPHTTHWFSVDPEYELRWHHCFLLTCALWGFMEENVIYLIWDVTSEQL